MIKVIIFDLGGVYINSPFKELAIHLNKKFGIDFEKAMDLLSSEKWEMYKLGEISEKEYLEDVIEKTGIKSEVSELKKTIRESKEIEGVREFLRNLKGKYTLAMLTNNGKEWFDYFIKKYSLDEIFEILLSSHQCKMKKPDKEIFEFIVKKLNVNTNECVLIDDQKRIIDGAEKVGMYGIIFKNIEQLKTELKNLGVEVE